LAKTKEKNMKRIILQLYSCPFVCLLACWIALANDLNNSYSVTDLGTLGGSESAAVALNNYAEVVGSSSLPGDAAGRAFLWQKGKMINLGTIGDGNSFATAINNRHEIVGAFYLGDGSRHAFLWQKGKMTDLGTLGGTDSLATAINLFGQVVGYSETAEIDNDSGEHVVHAFLWENGNMKDLGGLLGGPSSYSIATGINRKGQIVGESAGHGFLWDKGVITDLGTLGGIISEAYAINNRGQIVGYSRVADSIDDHPFLWHLGTMQDLGFLPGTGSSKSIRAMSINTAAQVVGVVTSDLGNQAFLWENGVMSDLNESIPADSGWQLHTVEAINRFGQIAGAGLLGDNHSNLRAFLLNPSRDDGSSGIERRKLTKASRAIIRDSSERKHQHIFTRSDLMSLAENLGGK
jgi:probable HAF family extracellular repeat protein